MIVVELAFAEGSPERLAARAEHRHLLEHLHAAGSLFAAGPWDDDTGALLVFAGDMRSVRAIMSSDPYYSTKGVRVVSVRDWRLVVGPETS